MSTEAAPEQAHAQPKLNPLALGRGLAVLRIFVGVIALANGLAKLTGIREINIGPYFGTLVSRPEAKTILDFETNGRGEGSQLPLLPSIVNDLILPNYGLFGWLLTFTEIATGALLILGLLSRGTALIVFAQHFFLQLVYFSSGRFAFEQPHEWLPPLILALVPAGMVWGLDRRLARNRERARWPS